MTLRASHSLMQAAERIFRRIVIEFRNCTYRLPACGGVAVLARNAEAAMGAARDGRLPESCGHREAGRSQNKEDPRKCTWLNQALCLPRLNRGCTSGSKEMVLRAPVMKRKAG